ncbi:hypothetical protein ThidrDRAFT_0258 [Thiorhodococcus drewsii AZ1]|uniref:Uncharacterized protein n=1 Tax=Thiorhodococcus drewsii AZ1 TaxID=765913 RepID=G2DVT8_9GAMM|nr:hypothetical protein ThidrDRAFT_0258 [Thiorhodococcus drewsii AZ1]
MRDYCGLCYEGYDEGNLGTCKQCGASYCYRCGSNGLCDRCASSLKPSVVKDMAGDASPSIIKRICTRLCGK